MRNSLKTLAISALIGVAAATGAKADYCNDVVVSAVNQQLATQFTDQTAEVRSMIADLESIGRTNTTIYRQLREALDKARQDYSNVGTQAANQGINECRQGLAPVQNVVDNMIVSMTGGLSLILPAHMTHIDMGEVLSGNILGGDNSFFRKNLGLKW